MLFFIHEEVALEPGDYLYALSGSIGDVKLMH